MISKILLVVASVVLVPSIFVQAASPLVLIGNESSFDTSVMSYESTGLKLVTKLPMAAGAYEVVVSPDKTKFYVSCANLLRYTGAIVIYDARTFTQLGFLEMKDAEGKGSPFSLVISKDGKKLYASNRQDNRVHVYDLQTNKLLTTIDLRLNGPAEWAIRFLTLSEDGSKLFVTGQGNNALYVIRTDTNTQEAAYGGFGVPRGMAIRGNMLYVANEKLLNGVPPGVIVFNTTTNKIEKIIPVDPSIGEGPQTLALSTDKKIVYVALAFGRLIGIDADPLSGKYLSIVTSSVPTSSQYHYGVMTMGDSVFITNQADRGSSPNSIEEYKQDINNQSVLTLIRTVPTGGVGPYLMTNFIPESRAFPTQTPTLRPITSRRIQSPN